MWLINAMFGRSPQAEDDCLRDCLKKKFLAKPPKGPGCLHPRLFLLPEFEAGDKESACTETEMRNFRPDEEDREPGDIHLYSLIRFNASL